MHKIRDNSRVQWKCLDLLNSKQSRREDHPEITRRAVHLQVCKGLLPFDNILDAKTIEYLHFSTTKQVPSAVLAVLNGTQT